MVEVGIRNWYYIDWVSDEHLRLYAGGWWVKDDTNRFPIKTRKAVAAKKGLKTDFELPSIQEMKNTILWTLKIGILISISITMGSLLNPLESITRYPDPNYESFNEKNPYIMKFRDLRGVIRLCLEKAEEVTS